MERDLESEVSKGYYGNVWVGIVDWRVFVETFFFRDYSSLDILVGFIYIG